MRMRNPKDKDENLSTEYYSLYKGIDTRKNKPVWIKEYELTTISKGSLEEEANRIKREADALQDLNKSHNVEDFKVNVKSVRDGSLDIFIPVIYKTSLYFRENNNKSR